MSICSDGGFHASVSCHPNDERAFRVRLVPPAPAFGREGQVMRYLIALWVSPLVLFWGWYFLSLNDMNFGYVMLSRRLHDLVFQLYGNMLGIDPATIPVLVARACVFDSFLVACLLAFRGRKAIAARMRQARERYLDRSAPSI